MCADRVKCYGDDRMCVYCGCFLWFQIITPGKRKMSEASMIVPGADRYTVRSPILLTNTCKFCSLKRLLINIIFLKQAFFNSDIWA